MKMTGKSTSSKLYSCKVLGQLFLLDFSYQRFHRCKKGYEVFNGTNLLKIVKIVHLFLKLLGTQEEIEEMRKVAEK